jgi:hypothetical protein
MFGGELSYTIQYLSSLRSDPIRISLVVSNSLTSDEEGRYDEEAVQALSHDSSGLVSRLWHRYTIEHRLPLQPILCFDVRLPTDTDLRVIRV